MEFNPPKIDTGLSDPPKTETTYVNEGAYNPPKAETTSIVIDEDGKPQIEWPSLLAMKNNVVQQVKPCAPWEFVPKEPPRATKDEHRKWLETPGTDHCVYTATEAVNPAIRPSKNNPVKKLIGLIADFDAKVSEEAFRTVLERCPADLRPNFISRTFSNGARLLWLFSEAVPLEVGDLAKHFLKLVAGEIKLKKIFAGFDEAAFLDLHKLYDVGCDWKVLSTELLSSNTVHLWLTEAAKKTNWSKIDDLHIPIEAVADEVERQFNVTLPDIGQRTNRFWTIDKGDNPTAAIVTEAGMIAFSGDQLFYPWSQVLGPAFVRKFQADKIGAAVDGVWFDGTSYYRKIGDAWRSVAKEDFVKYLQATKGLDRNPGKDTASETTRAEVFVQEHRRVDGVIPWLFDARDVVEINGKRFLNNSHVKAIQPAEEPQEWGVKFPWIARFLELRYDDIERQYFLGWWKRFYCSALQGYLLKGHTLFLVGGPRTGKTLLCDKMVGASVGGSADASAHISKGSEFNKELCEVALWTINDGEAATDLRTYGRFSERVKAAVANPQLSYRAMRRDAQTVTWNGRLLVTLNMDGHSLQMIPDLAVSMAEKVMVLKFQDTPYSFPPNFELERTIATELPYFLRWLVDWKTPVEIIDEHRLGVKSYINEELRQAVEEESPAATLRYLIDCFFVGNENCDGGKLPGWISSRALRDRLHFYDNNNALKTELGGARLGRILSTLGKNYVREKRHNKVTNAGEYWITSPKAAKPE